MKRFDFKVYLLGALCLTTLLIFSSCTSSDDPVKKISKDDVYSYLQYLNVKDAKAIYYKQSSSRSIASQDEGWYKLDFSGKEAKLIVTPNDTTRYQISIDRLEKLSDDYLLIWPNLADVMSAISDNNKNNVEIKQTDDISTMNLMSLVDTKTGKIYRWPDDAPVIQSEGDLSSKTDSKGNILFAFKFNSYTQVYRLDTKKISVEALLPENISFDIFAPLNEQDVIYGKGTDINMLEAYVKLANGSIFPVPTNQLPFIFGDKLYTIDSTTGNISRYDTAGENGLLQPTEILQENDLRNYTSLDAVPNPLHETILLGFLYEFDGKAIVRKLSHKLYISTPWTTVNAWYNLTQNNTLEKISMEDYSESTITFPNDIKVQGITTTPDSPDVKFYGYRYQDGKSIIGTISNEGKVTVDHVSEGNNAIVKLIPLN